MFLKKHFVFFDYTEPLVFFMLDYIAVMGLFIAVGYYLGLFLRKIIRDQICFLTESSCEAATRLWASSEANCEYPL